MVFKCRKSQHELRILSSIWSAVMMLFVNKHLISWIPYFYFYFIGTLPSNALNLYYSLFNCFHFYFWNSFVGKMKLQLHCKVEGRPRCTMQRCPSGEMVGRLPCTCQKDLVWKKLKNNPWTQKSIFLIIHEVLVLPDSEISGFWDFWI